MIQLKYNEDFNEIVNDLSFYHEIDEISQNIKDFIFNISNNRIIYEKEYDNYYCPNCLEKINKKLYCKKCHKHYSKDFIYEYYLYNKEKILDENKELFCEDFTYGFFDVVEKNVILYVIKEIVDYYNWYGLKKEYKVINAYNVKEDGLFDLLNNKYINFYDIEDKLKYMYSDYYYDCELTEEYDNAYIQYFYLDNLDILKDTLYKYSYIWNTKKYLSHENIHIFLLTFSPIFNKSFEYLIKYKLYNLAYHYPYQFKNGNNFKEIFGIDKNYLSFMQKYNVDYYQLEALKLCKEEDIKLVNFISEQLYFFEDINNNIKTINYRKLMNYFNENNYESNKIIEYKDYLRFAKELNLNLKDKNILYPDNLDDAHNNLYLQISIKNNPDINNNIKKIAKLLEINKYEDDNYIIFPAPSIESLIDESKDQNNCVRTYSEMYSKGETYIFFLRDKKNINKSLVTIEVKNKKVVQARVKYNDLPNKDLMNIINKWEKQLIDIKLK